MKIFKDYDTYPDIIRTYIIALSHDRAAMRSFIGTGVYYYYWETARREIAALKIYRQAYRDGYNQCEYDMLNV